MLKLYCLRHGEPETTGLLLGSTDLLLSEAGHRQMQQSCDATHKKFNLHRVYSSPLQRCAAFAKPWAASKKLPYAQTENLREYNFGQWDGKDVHDLWQQDQVAMESFWQDPWINTPPDAEPLSDFYRRVIDQVKHLANSHRDENILLVCHGGVISTLVAWASGIPLESGKHFRQLEISYASISQIEIFTDSDDQPLQPKLIFSNHR